MDASTWRALADSISPIVVLRTAYLAAAGLVLFVFLVPALNSRFLDYGPRSTTTTAAKTSKIGAREDLRNGPSLVSDLLDYLAGMSVPHDWFTSFYATSVACSMFWLSELFLKGPAFRAISSAAWNPSPTMTVTQVQISWLLMLVQGSRRLYECLAISKPSQSKMWSGHWALGIMFYCLTSVAVWIEGIPALSSHSFTASDLAFKAPSLKSFVGVLLFVLASGFQHDCHAYLASLRGKQSPSSSSMQTSTYHMPEHPAWNLSLTPHYLAECLLYLAIAIVAAPAGAALNLTLTCALVFVTVNLGVTASGTKQWYAARFGEEAVKGRARMIPGVY